MRLKSILVLLKIATCCTLWSLIANGAEPSSKLSIAIWGPPSKVTFTLEWRPAGKDDSFRSMEVFSIAEKDVPRLISEPPTSANFELRLLRWDQTDPLLCFPVTSLKSVDDTTAHLLGSVMEVKRVPDSQIWKLKDSISGKDEYTLMVKQAIGGSPKEQTPPSQSIAPKSGDIVTDADRVASADTLLVEVFAKNLDKSEGGDSGELSLLVVETTNRLPSSLYNFDARLKEGNGKWFKNINENCVGASIFQRSIELADLNFLKRGAKHYLPLRLLEPVLLPNLNVGSRTFEVIAAECDPVDFSAVASECSASSVNEFRAKLKTRPGLFLLDSGIQSVDLGTNQSSLVSLKSGAYEYQLRLEIVKTSTPERADFARFREYGTEKDVAVFGKRSGDVSQNDLISYFEFLEQINSFNGGCSLFGFLLSSSNSDSEDAKRKKKLLEWVPSANKTENRIPLDAFLSFRNEGGELFLLNAQGAVVKRTGVKSQDIRNELRVLATDMAEAMVTGVVPPASGLAKSQDGIPMVTLPKSGAQADTAVQNKVEQIAYDALIKGSMIFTDMNLSPAKNLQLVMSEAGLPTEIPFDALRKEHAISFSGGNVLRWFKVDRGQLTAAWPEVVVDKQGETINSVEDQLLINRNDGTPLLTQSEYKSNVQDFGRKLLVDALLKNTVKVSSPFRETQDVQPIVRSDGRLELPLSDGALKKFRLKVSEKTVDGNIPINLKRLGGCYLTFAKGERLKYTFDLTNRDDISFKEIVRKIEAEDLSEITAMQISFPNAPDYANEILLARGPVEVFSRERFLLSNFVEVIIEIPSEDLYKPKRLEPADFDGFLPSIYVRYAGDEYLLLTRFAKEKINIRGRERNFPNLPNVWKWEKDENKYIIIKGPFEVKPALIEGVYPLDAIIEQLKEETSRFDSNSLATSSVFQGIQDIKANLRVFTEKDPAKLVRIFNRHPALTSGIQIFPLEFFIGETGDNGKSWKPVKALFLLPKQDEAALECVNSPTSDFVFRYATEKQVEVDLLKKGFSVATDRNGKESLARLMTRSNEGYLENKVFQITSSLPSYFISAVKPELSDQPIEFPESAPKAVTTEKGPLHIVIINEALDINYLTLVLNKIQKMTLRISDNVKSERQVQFHVVFQGSVQKEASRDGLMEVASGNLGGFGGTTIPSIPKLGVAVTVGSFGQDRISSAISKIEEKQGTLHGNILILVNSEPSPEWTGVENSFLKKNSKVIVYPIGSGGFSQQVEAQIAEKLSSLMKPVN